MDGILSENFACRCQVLKLKIAKANPFSKFTNITQTSYSLAWCGPWCYYYRRNAKCGNYLKQVFCLLCCSFICCCNSAGLAFYRYIGRASRRGKLYRLEIGLASRIGLVSCSCEDEGVSNIFLFTLLSMGQVGLQ